MLYVVERSIECRNMKMNLDDITKETFDLKEKKHEEK